MLGDRYRLLERIGAGGMAVVWRAYDEILHRPVAVKMLSPAVGARPDGLRLLRTEALAAANLQHPHITQVYDYGEHVAGQARPYLVMELVDGVTLLQTLHAHPAGLGWPRTARITAETAAALAAAHARGVVHRDVTPANVMLTARGVKVLDFGICTLAGTADADDELVGTIDYIAPERVAGTSAVTPACDVYALGIVFYRCLTGQLPWRETTPTQRLRDHVLEPPRDLPPLPGLPGSVRELYLACLAKKPEDRPTAAEIAAELGEGVSLPPVPAADRVTGDLTRLLAITRAPVPATSVPPGRPELNWWERTPVLVAGALLTFGLTATMVAAGVPEETAARFTPADGGYCATGDQRCQDVSGRTGAPSPVPAPAAQRMAPQPVSHPAPADVKGKPKPKPKGRP
ncbi:protein kinase [Catellatospora sp. IY07-71]|nr:protein kinase [Catellatospora sp. IY07-71]